MRTLAQSDHMRSKSDEQQLEDENGAVGGQRILTELTRVSLVDCCSQFTIGDVCS